MMNEKFLLTALLGGGVLVYGLLYLREGRYDFRIAFDKAIPFVPAFIIPYLAFFPFVISAWFLLFRTPFLVPFTVSLIVAVYTAALFWYLFPGKTYRPEVSGQGFFERLVTLLYDGGSHANQFPSAHVFSCVISSFYLSLAFPAFSALAWGIGALIALSTLFTKQHHVIDFAGGVAWAIAALALTMHLVG